MSNYKTKIVGESISFISESLKVLDEKYVLTGGLSANTTLENALPYDYIIESIVAEPMTSGSADVTLNVGTASGATTTFVNGGTMDKDAGTYTKFTVVGHAPTNAGRNIYISSSDWGTGGSYRFHIKLKKLLYRD